MRGLGDYRIVRDYGLLASCVECIILLLGRMLFGCRLDLMISDVLPNPIDCVILYFMH